jgi:hypothetical protein
MNGAMVTIDRINHLLKHARLPAVDEKRTQGAVEAVLTAGGIVFSREHRLSGADIVDFLTDDGVAIEVKLKAPKREIHRQCGRYCAHAEVMALIVVSGTAMGLPDIIDGKPVYMISVGRGWL